MKRVFPIVLTAGLGISLWFNWRNRMPGPNVAAAPSGTLESAAPVLPGKVEEMDFSGTGLADEAWQLSPPEMDGKIPSTLPAGEGGEPTAPPPVPEAWEPEVKLPLSLDSRPP